MRLIITVEINDYTGDITASMSPTIGLLQVHRDQIVIWENPKTSNSAYDKAMMKQKSKAKLRQV